MNIYIALIFVGIGLIIGYGAMWLYCRIKNKRQQPH